MIKPIKKVAFFSVTLLTLCGMAVPSALAATGVISSSTNGPALATSWSSQATGNILALSGDNNGSIYILDGNSNEVDVRKSADTGGSYSSWLAISLGDQNDGALVANPTNGDIYYGNAQDGVLYDSTADGSLIGMNVIDAAEPTSATVDSQGNIYTTDFGWGVAEYDSNTTAINHWCSLFSCYGSGNTQFEDPTHIAVNPVTGNVYVADIGQGNIREFTSSGTFIKVWANYAADMATDSAGNVFVTTNNQVKEYTADGTLEATLAMPNSGLIFVDSNNNIFVTDNNNIDRYAVPKDVATVTSATNNSSTIQASIPTSDQFATMSSEQATTTNGNLEYPFGLVDFSLKTTSGGIVPVTIKFQTSLKPSAVTPQKYDPTTHTYTTIPGAVVTETTLNGQPALAVSYNVTDGGSLDEDGTINGTIVDPITLAVSETAVVSAPATGYGQPQALSRIGLYMLVSISLCVLGFASIARNRLASRP